MIARYKTAQEMYSPNTGMKIPRKSPRNPLIRTSKPLAHKIYKYMRGGERERRESIGLFLERN